MKVVFLEDVEGVARGGDVKEVKNGFARNYLLPKELAVAANANALKRVERLARSAEDTRLKHLSNMKALAEELDGTQVNIETRAGVSGRLYGSVTSAIVSAKLGEMTDREIERRAVEIAEPIRETGVFEIKLRLHEEVDAAIKLVVYATGSTAEEMIEAVDAAAAEATEAEATESTESESEPVAEEPATEAEPDEAAEEPAAEPEPSEPEPADESAEGESDEPDSSRSAALAEAEEPAD